MKSQAAAAIVLLERAISEIRDGGAKAVKVSFEGAKDDDRHNVECFNLSVDWESEEDK